MALRPALPCSHSRWLAAVESPSPLMLFSLYSAAATADGPLSRGCRGRNGDSRVCPPAPLGSNERTATA